MLKNKLIDKIIKEPLGGAHHDPEKVFNNVSLTIDSYIYELMNIF